MVNGIITARCVTIQKFTVLFHFTAEASNHAQVSYFTRLALNETLYVPYFVCY